MGYTNRLVNPRAEDSDLLLESDSAVTVGRTNVASGSMPADGSYFYTLSASSTAEARARVKLTKRAAAAAGDEWWGRVKLQAGAANAGTRRFSIGLRFYDAVPGATAGTTLGTTYATAVDLAAGAGGEVIVHAIAPSGTQSVGIIVRRETGLSPSTGDGLGLDQLALVKGAGAGVQPPLGVPGETGWYWLTTAETGLSYFPVTTPTLTPLPDDDPSPRVQIVFPDLPPTLRSITVYRDDPDDIVQIVRDARGAVALQAFTVTDLEVPVNRPVRYFAAMFDEAGTSLGNTRDAVVTVVRTGEPLTVWLSDPLDPGTVVKGIIADAFASKVLRARGGDFVSTSGSTDPTLLSSGMQGYQNLPLDFYTETKEATRAFRALRDQTPLAVLRVSDPEVPIPGTLYVALLDPEEVRIDAEYTMWAWTSRSARNPASGVIVPLRSYADYLAFYPTYAAAMAIFTLYVDAILNPPPDSGL